MMGRVTATFGYIGKSKRQGRIRLASYPAFSRSVGLEAEPQTDLHDARRALDLSKIGPVVRRLDIQKFGIWIHGQVTIVSVGPRQVLGISHVKDLPAECKFLFFAPGHRKDLAEPHVEVYVTRFTEHVSLACLSGIRRTVTLVSSNRVASEELGRVISVTAGWASRNMSDHCYVTLNFPVRGPLACIVWLAVR